MLKIMPRVKTMLEKLPLDFRFQNGIDRSYARKMHVVDVEQINMPDRIVRYNLRQNDGTIKKVTMFDSFIKEDILAKNNNSYEKISSSRIDI